jgi:hypothetical protein
MARSVLLGAALLALVAVAAAAPPIDKEGKENRDEARAAKKKAASEWLKRERGPKNGKDAPGADWKERAADRKRPKERMTPEAIGERRKASALFSAIIEPRTPKDVSFPLSEFDNLKFHSAREGLMDHVMNKVKDYDLNNADTKKTLRETTLANQEKARQLLIAAVKAGKTLQASRVGLIIAQFEALSEDEQKAALVKGKERLDKMPAGARDKAMHRQQEKHKEELAQIQALGSDEEKEEWLNKRYKPAGGGSKLPKLLE